MRINCSNYGTVLSYKQKSNMQSIYDQKEINEDRFNAIDQKWGRVEDAIRIEAKERCSDITGLSQNLKQHVKTANTLQTRKIQLIDRRLNELGEYASECKENLNQMFEDEADFRLRHLDQKNEFIQKYTQDANNYNRGLQQYMTSRMGDLGTKLQNVDAANRRMTQQALKELKEEIIGEAKEHFKQEKEKYTQALRKVTQDSDVEFNKLRALLKVSQRQRQENEGKLRLMIQGLTEELSKLCNQEEQEGETTYDSLLKMLEECCDRIQQAQLR